MHNVDPHKQARRIGWIDYGRLANMVLALVVGGVMLIRALLRGAPWPAYLMGAGFLIFGGYRLYLLRSRWGQDASRSHSALFFKRQGRVEGEARPVFPDAGATRPPCLRSLRGRLRRLCLRRGRREPL